MHIGFGFVPVDFTEMIQMSSAKVVQYLSRGFQIFIAGVVMAFPVCVLVL